MAHPLVHVKFEVSVRMMFGVIDQNQVGIDALFKTKVCQTAVGVGGPHVAVDDDKRFASEQRQRPPDTAAGFERLRFAGPGYLHTEPRTIAHKRFDLLTQPRRVDDQLANTRARQPLNVVLNDRLAMNFQQWLGRRFGQRSQPFTKAGSQNHGFHTQSSKIRSPAVCQGRYQAHSAARGTTSRSNQAAKSLNASYLRATSRV